MICNVCSSPSSQLARALVLRKYEVEYYICDSCNFIQTEPPYWLAEAYSESISKNDIGLLGRNISLTDRTAAVICFFFNPNSRFLDYGGGNGMFVRLMRDKGYDFYWRDKYTSNMFATGFEAKSEGEFELTTCFEVFEHLPKPIEEIEQMLSFSKNILFTTSLVPNDIPLPDQWWYYSLETGQHISLYSKKSLFAIARRFNLNLYSDGISLHLLTPKKLATEVSKILRAGRYSKLVQIIFNKKFKRKSLLADDYFRLTGRRLD